MARQSATPQNSTPIPPPPYANVAIRSPAPTHAEPPKPVIAPSAPGANPLGLLEQLRMAGLLPSSSSSTPTNAGPTAPPAPPTFPPNLASLLASTRAVAPPAPGTVINAAALKQPFRHDLLSQLYDALGPPCTQCGRRFQTDAEGKKKKTAHMDWHFRVHQRGNEAEKKGMHRSWYVDHGDWLKSREAIDADHIPAPEEVAAEAFKVAEAAKPKYIPVPDPSKGINNRCPICQDKFENKWLDTAQEWVWLDTVLVGTRAYHASCHAEATRDREGTPNYSRRTPEPVLGKRKAEVSISSPKASPSVGDSASPQAPNVKSPRPRLLHQKVPSQHHHQPHYKRLQRNSLPLTLLLLGFLLGFPTMAVDCPICNKPVKASSINSHIDSGCSTFLDDPSPPQSQTPGATATATQAPPQTQNGSSQKRSASSFFSTPAPKRQVATDGKAVTPVLLNGALTGKKRSFEEGPGEGVREARNEEQLSEDSDARAVKKTKTQRAAPLAERMRPKTLDDVCGQDLVGPNGVLRSLIESDRVPSMILWGASGTGKTTIARCIAHMVGSRFVELNATSTGVSEVKKLFHEAASELALTGRKTIVFCDEIHRFNKAQQDVFLKPVEAGTVTLIGATTENPSFKVANALLSRCRTFTLQALATEDIIRILQRALKEEAAAYPPTTLVDDDMVAYLARFSDGDARTALNLLELALSLTSRADTTKEDIKAALTKTLVYDRAGDQHYDTISAFHKSVRGNDADAALYYLARMLQSGEDPLFIARRMVVIASEDIGLADGTLLPLATAAYTATQQIGMPEARIPLAHCAVALCAAPKSTRAYRGLNNAYAALREPGVASLPVPVHLRNAPTRLMRELGYGAEYKYPPNYREGKVRQTYLPDDLVGRKFLEERHLGTEVDPDLEMGGT
ncbi:hypothetical protein G7046_g9443 [Stylonectria norvegica]|nr:hypothetical protein G7046_g9443 [Stylonectria norvegica]